MGRKRVLACETCKSRNYSFTSDKKDEVRLELKKYCKQCKEHTIHLETR
ncbi:50S ribosomal protein L33 [Bacillus sp. JCM 19041]